MKLSLGDRLTIGVILPREASFTDLVIIRDITKKIDPTQEEIKTFEIKAAEKAITWNQEGGKAEFDIEFTDLEIGIIKASLKKLDDEKSLTMELFDIYKKFNEN